MMNRLLLIALAIGLSLQTSAQVKYQKTADLDYFEAFESTDRFMFSFTPVKKEMQKSQLTIFDHDGNTLNTILLEDKYKPTYLYSGTVGNKTVIAMSNDKFLILDEKGKELEQKSFHGEDKVKDEQMLFHDNGVVVIQQIKIKKVGVGLRIRGFDTAFNETWSYEKFPEKGRYRFTEAAVKANGELAFIYQNSSKQGLCLISAAGEEKAFALFEASEDKMKDYLFTEGPDGYWNLIGHYGDAKEKVTGIEGTTYGSPLGALILKFDPESGEMSESKLNYLEIQAKYGDLNADGEPLYSQNAPILQILDIVNLKGKDYYMCESILMGKRTTKDPSSSSEAPTTMTYTQLHMQDLYLLDYKDPLAAPVRIWKPERTIEVKVKDPLDPQAKARKTMTENRMYSYQGIYDGKIVIRGFAQMHHYYNLIDPDLGVEKLEERVFWSRPIGSNQVAFPPRATYYKSNASSFGVMYLSRAGLLPVGDSFMIYNYDSRSNKLQLSKFNK